MDGRLAWSAASVGATVAHLPGYVLLGGLSAVLFTWLGVSGRRLFTDDAAPALWVLTVLIALALLVLIAPIL